MSNALFEIPVTTIKGEQKTLADFGGKAVLAESKDGIDPVELTESATIKSDPSVAAYAQAISRTIRK